MSSEEGKSSPYAFWAFFTLYKSLHGGSGSKVSFNEVCDKLYPEYPVDTSSSTSLFVTWKKKPRGRGHNYSLRGCIGTFSQLPVVEGIERYSLVAALQDRRFSPITAGELSQLKCGCNILHSFETIYNGQGDIYDWEVGTHGIELQFRHPQTGGTLSSTFLPEVIPEQGWDQNETFLNLIEKAGVYAGAEDVLQDYERYFIQVIRYEGEKSSISFEEFEDQLAKVGE